jgi:arginyl-tRNA synthetase
MLIKHEIARLVADAAARAQEEGDLPPLALPEVSVEHPAREEHGDYAASLPMKLARAARSDPLAIAEAIAKHIRPSDAIAEVAVAPPGFINFRLSDVWLARQVDAILAQGERFGDVPLGQGQRFQVEFVSANPVGPLHVGNGRGLAIGDTLAGVLAAAGYAVEREYLVNDAGTQTETFASTLYARYQQLFGREVEVPEGGYPGHYMAELAEELKAEHGEAFLRPTGEPWPPELHDVGVAKMLAVIRSDLAAIGVNYDVWFSEKSLYAAAGTYERAMELLREKGVVAEKEGAIWFTSSALGEDKDNVLVRSTGSPTYFASDIAYHYDKFLLRGFQRVIDVWGADHQGHVPRMQAAVAALGVDPEQLDIIIYQLVTLRRGTEIVRLSKRTGEIITLSELVEEVGADACRFFFLARAADSHMDFDLELAKRQSAENPVYYVQYAHARIAGILAHADEQGVDYADGDLALLSHPAELALIRRMLLLPEVVEGVARTLEPHHLPHYALELATVFHDFYEKCRVVSDDLPLSKARLKLVAACKIALARTLGLMGVSAPDRM